MKKEKHTLTAQQKSRRKRIIELIVVVLAALGLVKAAGLIETIVAFAVLALEIYLIRVGDQRGWPKWTKYLLAGLVLLTAFGMVAFVVGMGSDIGGVWKTLIPVFYLVAAASAYLLVKGSKHG